jgi:hypothetical protein
MRTESGTSQVEAMPKRTSAAEARRGEGAAGTGMKVTNVALKNAEVVICRA